MLGAYFTHLENSLQALESSNNDGALELKNMRKEMDIIRRDLNDVHSIIMLRDVAQKIKKENIVAFIGTGQINENVIHAFICCKLAQAKGDIDTGVEIIFVARSPLEYNLLLDYGFDGVYQWQYQSSLSMKLLKARTVVASTHLFSDWGNCLLSACVSNATVVQLWHGLPAKRIGMGGTAEKGSYHFFARMFNDVVNTDYVFIENNLENTRMIYEQTFPGCSLLDTGSVRLHILFDEKYRQLFLSHKQDGSITDWIARTNNKRKVLYCPTYRENKELGELLFNNIKIALSKQYSEFSLAIKPHIAVGFTPSQISELTELAKKNNHLYIDRLNEVYSAFPDFDAIVTDYSSIRIDFATLGKPVFLYQFDQERYYRHAGAVELFSELDTVSYHLTNFDELSEFLQKDEKRVERESFVNNRLKALLYDDSANRVVNAILEIHKESDK